MKFKLVFEDWKKSNTGESVYNTQEYMDLTYGSLHAGTVFHADIDFSESEIADIKDAKDRGVIPTFILYEKE